ncbi:MAG: serine/threonine protein phosphatase [Saprospiraceae bacterium]|nr:serine/threonine protein phosphatase [Saprospiraceae bacterium]
MRQFAISDIHGCNISFNALLDQIGLTTADELFLLGDYIDRGPDSKGVLDTIMGLRSNGYKVRCLMGNHDEAMVKALYDFEFCESWLDKWGGKETVASFEAYSVNEIPLIYWQFLETLEHYIELDDFLLVHAGLNWSSPKPLQDLEGILYARNWYHKINYDWLNGKKILHGHTPIVQREMLELLEQFPFKHYLNLDNGCVYDRYGDGSYHLCAFDMTNRQLVFQKCLDDVSGYWAGR